MNKEHFNIPTSGIVMGSLVILGCIVTGVVLYKKNKPSSAQSKTGKQSEGFPLLVGSSGELVSILQSKLKRMGADLGKSGVNRDGIDGKFGPKTESAALKYMGARSITKAEFNRYK